MYRCFLVFALAVGLVSSAAAQAQRHFPGNALRGAFIVVNPSQASLNGDPVALAPGLRIHGQNNLLEMSGALIGARLLVNYTLDTGGAIHEVWVLTPDEAARSPWPTTPEQASAWQFDPVAQVWTRP